MWVSPTPLGGCGANFSLQRANTRARKYETELLYLIGEKHTFRSPSDGDGLNGLSSR